MLPSAVRGLSPVGSALSSEAAETGVSGARSLANPKSSSFAPDLVSMTLPGLEVAVDDPVTMSLVESARDLDPVAQDLLEGKRRTSSAGRRASLLPGTP
jgi:hypothetical protein